MAAGPFDGIEPLIRAGRYGEAASALKGSARAGGDLWEVCLWLGRIEERRGRLGEAEKAFRKALAANPRSPLPRLELSRLLEEVGKDAEARTVRGEASARAAEEMSSLVDGLLHGRTGGVFAERLEFDLYRGLFLEAVAAGKADARRIEAALRAALRGGAGSSGVRTLLAEVLLAGGRLEEAEAELAAAFRADGTEAERARVDAALQLVDFGRYSPELERALLARLARAAAGDKIWAEWPQLFSALMCAGMYPAAFRLGEAMLDKLGGFESPGHLMWPWRRTVRRSLAEKTFVERELSRIRAAGSDGSFPQWFAYYRALLLGYSFHADFGSEYRQLAALDSARYSWMLQSFVLVKLGQSDFEGTIRLCRDILKNAPDHWWVRCRLGEARLLQGEPAAALREFEAARASAEPGAKREVLTWHGEILLWLGRYAEALALLDEAVALGARTFVHGWRGAARLKLGDFPGALADLDRAVALDPSDFEARGWRGEAYRVLGRHADAVRELDAIVRAGGAAHWTYFNRALSRDALGDAEGLAEDYAAIDPRFTSRFAKELGIRRSWRLSADEMRRVLTAGLERAKGLRRWEEYVGPLWLGAEE